MNRLARTPLAILLPVLWTAALPAHAQTLSPQEVFRRVSGSVVVIEVNDSPREGETRLIASGSGVVVPSREKDITSVVTNCHVVAKAGDGFLGLTAGETNGLGWVAGKDAARDLCIVHALFYDADSEGVPLSDGKGEVAYQKLPAAQVGSSQWLEVGDPVYAVGAPQGLELSLSNGLVSGFREYKGSEYIQTTAPISKGSSGGGLFDAQGRLVGITTMYVKDGQALNFAVPAELIASIPAIGPAMQQAAHAPGPVRPSSTVASTSAGDRWKTFYEDAERTLDIDLRTVHMARNDPDTQRHQSVAWIRSRFSSPREDGDGIEYLEDVRRYTFWCAGSSFIVTRILQRDADGRTVFSHDYSIQQTRVQSVVPDSIGEAIRDEVCSL